MKNIIIYVSFIMLMLAGCSQVNREADIQAQKDYVEKWDLAIAAGDYKSIASMYTENAVRMDPYEPAKTGKEAIRASYQKTMERYKLITTTLIEDVTLCGNCAFLRCLTTGTLTSKTTGESIQIKNKAMAFRQRQQMDPGKQ